MAQVVLSARIAWWVTPYLWAIAIFARSVAPFMDMDDGRIEAFAERQSKFIYKHGIKLYAGNERIRD